MFLTLKHTPASQTAQSEGGRRKAASSLQEASASRQQATSRRPQAAEKVPSAGSGSNNACPSASNKTLHEKSQACSRQAVSRPSSKQEEAGPGSSRQHQAATRIAGSRQAAGSQQAGSKQPGTATMSGGGEHRYHAPQPCSATMSGGVTHLSQSWEPPPAAAVLGLPACRTASENKRTP